MKSRQENHPERRVSLFKRKLSLYAKCSDCLSNIASCASFNRTDDRDITRMSYSMRRPAVGDTSNRPGYHQQGRHGSLTLGCRSHLNSPPWPCPARNDHEPCIPHNSAMPRVSGIRTETGSQGHKFTNVLVFKFQATPQFSSSSLSNHSHSTTTILDTNRSNMPKNTFTPLPPIEKLPLAVRKSSES